MREIIEDLRFFDQLESLGNIRRLDQALEGVTWAIALDAEGFPIVECTSRLAKTRAMGDLPAFGILFDIIDDDLVGLYYIAPIED